MNRNNLRTAQRVTVLAFFTWGLTMLCRTSFGYYLEVLRLSSTQAGIANFFTAATICVSAIVIGRWAERTHRLLETLVIQLFIALAGMVWLAFAGSFVQVLLSRIVLGTGCGPVFTLVMALTRENSTPSSYPVLSGVVANGEAIINTILGPVLIVFFMGRIGFAWTNLGLGAILFILAVLWIMCRAKSASSEHAAAEKDERKRSSVAGLMKNRNIIICSLGGTFSLTAGWCIYVFAPALLKEAGGYSDRTMSIIMTLMGVFMAVWMVLIPYVSDRIGRRAAAGVFSLCGAVSLAALSIGPGIPAFAAVFIIFGGCCSVVSLIFMAVMPVESVREEESAGAIALVNAASELLGASAGPLIAGVIADAADIRGGMLFAALSMAGAAAAGWLFSNR